MCYIPECWAGISKSLLYILLRLLFFSLLPLIGKCICSRIGTTLMSKCTQTGSRIGKMFMQLYFLHSYPCCTLSLILSSTGEILESQKISSFIYYPFILFINYTFIANIIILIYKNYLYFIF